MPGKRITEQQIKLYMKSKHQKKSQKVAAARAGFSERTARNIEKRGFQPAKTERSWKTRKNPFEEVWEPLLVPMLEKNPALQAKTLLEYLQHVHEDQYPDTLLRTLQRKIKKWKALYGPEKEVIFRQNHPPGWQGLSDFTWATKLSITIQKEAFDHLLYHYRLAYSGWEHIEVVFGGESLTALTEGLQNALWQCGGAPETHRTDSLSAAFKNLSKEAQEDLTRGYTAFCAHYNMEPTRNNLGVSHENGTIESSHRHLKSRIEQALMIRNSRDFNSVEEYQQFVRNIASCHNRRVHKKYLEELSCLQGLPERKTQDFSEERVRVSRCSTFLLKGVIYSVPSKLIGEILKVHLYDARLECFVGGCHVATLPRKRKNKKCERQINYRHLIEALSRKPGSFNNYIYKDDFFPTLAFRQLWEHLNQHNPNRQACKDYIAILKEAAKGDNEFKVSAFLEKRLLQKEAIKASEIQALFFCPSVMPQLTVSCDSLASYACLTRRAS